VRFLDLLRFAAGALRGHRLRTALSVTGVAVGIAAVVTLTALGEGARQYVVDQFAALGSSLLVVFPGKVETTGGAPFGGVTHDLTIDDYRLVARLPRVRRSAPMAVATERVRYGDRGRDVPVLGTTSDFALVRRLEMRSGAIHCRHRRARAATGSRRVARRAGQTPNPTPTASESPSDAATAHAGGDAGKLE